MKQQKTLYRIQSIRGESLWYSFDGKFEDRLFKITEQSIPMPFDYDRQSDKSLKLLSAVEDIQMFPNWFSKEQIEKLFNSGYSLFKYEVDKCIYLPKGEVVFDYNTAISSLEVQEDILKVYGQLEEPTTPYSEWFKKLKDI